MDAGPADLECSNRINIWSGKPSAAPETHSGFFSFPFVFFLIPSTFIYTPASAITDLSVLEVIKAILVFEGLWRKRPAVNAASIKSHQRSGLSLWDSQAVGHVIHRVNRL